MFRLKNLVLAVLLLASVCPAFSQFPLSSGSSGVDYQKPKEYEIGGITISGIKYLDQNVLIQLSGLSVGDVINVPGEELSEAIRKLWKQGLFSDVSITYTKIIGDKIFLNIFLQEQPRLSKFSFNGVKKNEADDIREMIKLVKGQQVTENLKNRVENTTKDFFIEKGFLYAKVSIVMTDDTNMVNNVILEINIEKGDKIKINEISFEGVTAIKEGKLRRAMKETKEKKWYNIFKGSKYIESLYEADKINIVSKFSEKGYRDSKIIQDTIYNFDEKTINIHFKIEEGDKYFFRNISWVGNSKYSSKQLTSILGIKKGDLYNQATLDEKLYISPNGVFSLYQDDGYLFSAVTPVEVLVEKDSIDIEMRVYEGKQARINRVNIVGNDKTNEHVIRREIRTKPGQLYNRSDIQRTIRELAQLGYFDPEKLNVDFEPDPANGTVDLEYTVEEKPSDQFELSGGWGAKMIVGSVGLSFTNFSARNMLKPKAWKPIPTGDGQRLSIRAQSNGLWYQSYNMSFSEPWLGGKKPNMLTYSMYHSIVSNGQKKKIKDDNDNKILNEGRKSMQITGISLGLGKRLPWPDDYFSLYLEAGYQHYNLNGYNYMDLFSFDDGYSNNVSFSGTVARRSSGPNPIYPIMGSDFSFTLEHTLPYSLLKEDRFWEATSTEEEMYANNQAYLSQLEEQRKYLWIEYYKWSFQSLNYLTLASFGKNNHALVLHTRFEFGFIGYYNKDIGPSPFEGYFMGGDGLMTFNLYGKETIPLRGYENGSLTPYHFGKDGTKKSGNIYDKFTLELRFPISLNPSATLYALTFAEAGNSWYGMEKFNAFDVKRSAGVGLRIFLPMFGKLGVDWAYGFDEDNDPATLGPSGSQFHFIIGQNF